MTAKAAILALSLAAAAAQAQAAPQAAAKPAAEPAARSSTGLVQPPEANDSVFDDVAASFDGLFSGAKDRNLREMMIFRIKQGRCDDARRLAEEKGRLELVAMIPKDCPARP